MAPFHHLKYTAPKAGWAKFAGWPPPEHRLPALKRYPSSPRKKLGASSGGILLSVKISKNRCRKWFPF
jgi:hypothetical protein